VIGQLAEGGMGEIFLARSVGERGFEKVVVLKRILQRNVTNRDAVRMFMDEARLMAALNHPNVVQVYDFGTAAGSHFFAMEYVHGEDLGKIMNAATVAGRPLSLELAIGVIAEAAAALHYAHEQRGKDGTALEIVHRDISPSNLLVSYDGAVKLTDFGIAKWTKRETETRYGAIKGKIAYMSPEQCRAGRVDRRSDVFGLGILLFELTTGTRLYQGTSDFAILEQIVHQDAPRPSSRRADYPAAVEKIVMRALARDPRQRQQTARQLQLELEEYALEAKLKISGMARAEEMGALFGAKIEAWRQAIQAGRSLGEHLAAAGAEHGLATALGIGPAHTITRSEGTEVMLRRKSDGVPYESGTAVRRVVLAAGVLGLAGAGVALRGRLARTPAAVIEPPRPAPAPAPAPVMAAKRAVTEEVSAFRPRAAPEPPRSTSRRVRRRTAEPETPAVARKPPATEPAKREKEPDTAKKVWDPDSIYLP
jgi:tRNA A-37 threonylcarbamoyl transferase component Bud32